MQTKKEQNTPNPPIINKNNPFYRILDCKIPTRELAHSGYGYSVCVGWVNRNRTHHHKNFAIDGPAPLDPSYVNYQSVPAFPQIHS